VPTQRAGPAHPGAIARFLSEHPPVRIEVQAAGAADDAARLRDGRLDALITIAKPALDGLTAEPLIDDPLVIAGRAGHPLGGPATPGLVKLAGFGWALPETGRDERRAWERLFLDGGLYPPAPNVTCPSLPALLDLVAATDLLTVASRSSVDRSGGGLIPIGQNLGGGAPTHARDPLRLGTHSCPIDLPRRDQGRRTRGARLLTRAKGCHSKPAGRRRTARLEPAA
jgi:DNA-binding transcriptional LysR family regulator